MASGLLKKVVELPSVDSESLFKIEGITSEIPDKARIMESTICDFCGEVTKMDLFA